MKALSGLFQRMFGGMSGAVGTTARRRRVRDAGGITLSHCEPLEAKKLLAVDAFLKITDQTLASSATTIDLANHFRETIGVVGTVVKFETNAPLVNNDFYVELYDKAGAEPAGGRTTPITTANFLSYVGDDSYDGTMIHRSVTDFVIQGGGFTTPTVAADQPGSDPAGVSTKGTIANEPGNSNVRGSLAMAKLGGQPNSATSQWFVNLSDNLFLDEDNGGYTVFGEVVGDGMTVVDTLGSALTYEATTYYSNGAFSDLPFWNVNADNIVLPDDFVTIERVEEVAPRDFVSYAVTSSAPGVVTAQVVNGQLRLTPVNGQTGDASITVTATSVFDAADVVSRTFKATASGTQTPPTVVENAGSVSLTKDSTGAFFANGNAVRFLGGTHVKETTFPGYTIEAAEVVGGQRMILLTANASGAAIRWQMNDAWTYSAGGGSFAVGSDGYYQAETDFGVDLNGDTVLGDPSPTPTLTPVESAGSVTLATDADGKYYADDTAIIFGTDQLSNSYFPTSLGLTLHAAETIGGENLLLWTNSTGGVFSWKADTSWTYVSGADYKGAVGTPGFHTAETAFGVDVDDDGNIGAPPVTKNTIEDNGAVTLTAATADGALAADGISITYTGGVLKQNTFTAFKLSPIQAETIGGKNVLLFENTDSGRIFSWLMGSDWSLDSATGPYSGTPGSAGYAATEVAFNVDLDGDTKIGSPAPTLTAIESRGSVILSADQNGNYYAGTSLDKSTPLLFGGAKIDADRFAGLGLTIQAAEVVDGQNMVLWKNSTGGVFSWVVDTNWSFTAQGQFVGPQGSAAYYQAEVKFDHDVNDDGVYGAPFTIIETAGQIEFGKDELGRLYADGNPIRLNGNQINEKSFEGYTATAVDVSNGVTVLVWKLPVGGAFPAGGVSKWKLDQNFEYDGPAGSWQKDDDNVLELEEEFEVDLDGDDIRGRPLDTAGQIRLVTQERGRLYAGVLAEGEWSYDRVDLNGGPLRDDSLSGFTPLAAEVVDIGGSPANALLWRKANGGVWIWRMDVDWNYVAPAGNYDPGTQGFLDTEVLFSLDINGSGGIGS